MNVDFRPLTCVFSYSIVLSDDWDKKRVKSISFCCSWSTEEEEVMKSVELRTTAEIQTCDFSSIRVKHILQFLPVITVLPLFSESHISSISLGGPLPVLSECSHYVFSSPRAVNHVRIELLRQKKISHWTEGSVQCWEFYFIYFFLTQVLYWLCCTFTAEPR